MAEESLIIRREETFTSPRLNNHKSSSARNFIKFIFVEGDALRFVEISFIPLFF